MMNADDNCFACGKATPTRGANVTTIDGQIVFVGLECYRRIRAAGDAGYQPPKGGPRLFVVGSKG